MKIPFSNPGAGYFEHKEEIDRVLIEAAESGWYILGKFVSVFEEEFAKFVGSSYGVGVANGTDAVELALRAIDFGPGDVAITVSHTAVATVAAIERTGGRAVLVDIDEDSFCMDLESLRETVSLLQKKNVTPKAIIPVHIYGHPAPLKEIQEIGDSIGAVVIEDCAQAHGAKYFGKTVGSIGSLSAFSFYPTKNLGALGDGGYVATSDAETFERLKAIRQYGWTSRYISTICGVNSRLDEIHAAVLSVKLKKLNEDNQRRIRLAQIYTTNLSESNVITPKQAENVEHVYHLYVVRTQERQRLSQALDKNSIGWTIHYPVPIHLQPAYLDRNLNLVPLKNTEKIATEILSLPMFPQLTENSVKTVCDVLKSPN